MATVEEKGLVSVVVPAYNHERYIADTVRSILNQTCRGIELIVVDDGSRDGTFGVLEKLRAEAESRCSRVVFRTRPNAGITATMNELLSLVRGEYVFATASDDFASPEALEIQSGFLAGNPDYVLAVGDNGFVDENGGRIGWNERREAMPFESARFRTFGEFLQWTRRDVDFRSAEFGSFGSLMLGNYVPNGCMWRTEALRRAGGWAKGVSEDWYMNLQLARQGKFRYLGDILFFYRWHTSNTVRQIEKNTEWARVTREYFMKEIRSGGFSGDSAGVRDFLKNGRLLKSKVNVPPLFELRKIQFYDRIEKRLKLFGLDFRLKRYEY